PTVGEGVAGASTVGYPVVLKVSSAALPHKSELGLVRLGLDTEQAVRNTFAELAATPDIEGVLVCEQVTGGVELVVGLSFDEQFGLTVMAGVGGVSVEVYRDVAFRVPPFDRDEAMRMLQELIALPLLQGHRGRPAVDLDAVVDVILRVEQLAIDLPDRLRELDINPLLALPDRVVALDALAVLTD